MLLGYIKESSGPSAFDFDQLGDSVDSIQAELERWQDLQFSFDMEKDSGPNKGSSKGQQSSSGPSNDPDIQAATLLAQFAATAGSQPPSNTTPSVEQAYANLVQALLLSNGNLPPFMLPQGIPSAPPQQQQQNHMNSFFPPQSSWGQPQFSPGQPSPSSFYNFLPPSMPSPPSQPVASTSSAMSPDYPDNDSGNDMDTTDDKRRRNTAASARFRIKKKQRALNLERSVTELTGRAEELEREASELRRENGWLKEIVMLKGSSFQASLHAQAAQNSQASTSSTAPPHSSIGSFGPRQSSTTVEDNNSGEDSEVEESESASKQRRKGKGRRK